MSRERNEHLQKKGLLVEKKYYTPIKKVQKIHLNLLHPLKKRSHFQNTILVIDILSTTSYTI